MRVLETVSEIHEITEGIRMSGERIALVPTMGSLHEGHLSLIEIARSLADCVCVSIFVNPAQFDANEDFKNYPRSFERDLEICREVGVDLVFAPNSKDLCLDNEQTQVEVRGLSESLCGLSRPGHFNAVATVVGKLFLASKPHLAVFGDKDYQQMLVIRKMVSDLCFDLKIVSGPTIRESDGLALSSRNSLLSNDARLDAVALFRALNVAENAYNGGERRVSALKGLIQGEIERFPLAEVEYVELCDPHSLRPISEKLGELTLVALAAYFPSSDNEQGRVRLIDNRLLRDC